jgi:hypothetical protein
MRALILLLLFSASIAACSPFSGNDYPTTPLASTCPEIEGYPGCHSGQDAGATVTLRPAPYERTPGSSA